MAMQAHLGEWPGPVIDADTDEVVATHKGSWFYTIGQRSGLDLGQLENGPWCASALALRCHRSCMPSCS